MKIKFIFLCIVFTQLTLSGQSVILNSEIDTYIQSSEPGVSHTSETELKIKHTISQSNERSAWLKFQKENMPTNSQQVLLKLVKTGGYSGNISVVGVDPNFTTNLNHNNASSTIQSFATGGYTNDNEYYFDVTEYYKETINNSNSAIAFKLFSTSFFNNTMTFVSNESSDTDNRPQLLFYNSIQFDFASYDLNQTTDINTEFGVFSGSVIEQHTNLEERSTYGGWLNNQFDASGYFRVEKDCNNAWHIVDPEGYVFYCTGLNSVTEGGGMSIPEDLKDLGLNTIGNFSEEGFTNMAYTPRVNMMARFKNTSENIKATYDFDVLPVFEPTFKSFCEENALNDIPEYLNDPWVLGYFLDNELLFHRDQLSLSLELSNENAQYQEANNWMIAKYGVDYNGRDITEQDEATYQGYVAETYYKVAAEAIRKVDPNHMLIGSRLHATAKYIPEIIQAAKYMDILSVNYYGRFEPEEETFELWEENSDIPFLITEFYTKGDDTGMPNEDGAGWTVDTQNDRANWFENWMLKLLRSKSSVGYHWFRYLDKESDGSNKGLFTADYKLYEELGESFLKINQSIYTLRSEVLYGNSNYNGCITYDFQTLSSSENSILLSNLKVYPNPFKDNINLNLEHVQETISNINIFNINGKLVKAYEAEVNNLHFDVSNLAKGVYIMEIITNKNSVFKKIIKE